MKSTQTTSRKQQHIDLTLKNDVSFRAKSTGFERLEFQHNALPEINFSEVDTTAVFLGKKMQLPFIISSMTGGYRDAVRINRLLAEVCDKKNIALGVGSQRQAMENTTYLRSFSVVREVAKKIPVFGNLGAAEVAALRDVSSVQKLVDLIEADGFAVHLNPLQELLQPEGNTNFRGVLHGIETLVASLPVPVIVKEIGAGLSADVAQRLLNAGVQMIDVAGAGGTSWAGVELLRRKTIGNKKSLKLDEHAMLTRTFWDWGIPTANAVREIGALKHEYPSLHVIASGGMGSGLDAAKAFALGADYAAVARPILKVIESGGVNAAVQFLSVWEMELKGAMFLTGSRTINELQTKQLVENA
ncbi:MAG TPA: type 2 isopentenyl-diphosphate Delta-isomerase [Bacteroidota bacterium]|nr:type 2 isopentenyl-diphosphate Delta-isomerase [Bacteroidota bacterium]